MISPLSEQALTGVIFNFGDLLDSLFIVFYFEKSEEHFPHLFQSPVSFAGVKGFHDFFG